MIITNSKAKKKGAHFEHLNYHLLSILIVVYHDLFSEDECAEEDIDWNKIPVGWYPANEEEAVARIEAIEAEYENGQYIDAEEFEKELIAQYPWLA